MENYPINKFTEDYSILVGYRGSIAHGTYRPSTEENSIDDKDVMCVCVLPIDHYFGLAEYMRRGTVEIKPEKDDWDIVSYELRKFIALLKKGNPNVVSMLWLEPQDYLKVTEVGEILIRNRKIFNSKLVYHSFLGYANAQFKKMTHLAYEGYMGEKRKSLVRKFGYDTKGAAHLIRLMRMCMEWMDNGEFQVKRKDAEELLLIKNGHFPLDYIKTEANALFRNSYEKFMSMKNIDDEPDHKLIDAICGQIIYDRLIERKDVALQLAP